MGFDARTLLCVFVASCAAAAPPSHRTTDAVSGVSNEPMPTVGSECNQARALRASSRARLADGKLDRARREIARADRLCPQEARLSWATALHALLGLGSEAEAAALLAKIDEDPVSPPAARAAAARVRSSERREQRGTADELVGLALTARKSGDLARAQRLLDRAAASYERETGSPLSLCRVGVRVLPLEVCEERLLVTNGTREFFR